jgi:hypothetical protein
MGSCEAFVEGFNSVAAWMADGRQNPDVHNIMCRLKLNLHGITAVGGADESFVDALSKRMHIHRDRPVVDALLSSTLQRVRKIASRRYTWKDIDWHRFGGQPARGLKEGLQTMKKARRHSSNVKLSAHDKVVVKEVTKSGWRGAFLSKEIARMPATTRAPPSKRPRLGVTDDSKLSDLVRKRQKKLKASFGGVGDSDTEEEFVQEQVVEFHPQELLGSLHSAHVSCKKNERMGSTKLESHGGSGDVRTQDSDLTRGSGDPTRQEAHYATEQLAESFKRGSGSSSMRATREASAAAAAAPAAAEELPGDVDIARVENQESLESADDFGNKYPEAKEYLSRTADKHSSYSWTVTFPVDHKAAVRWDPNKRQFQSSRGKGQEKGQRKSFGLTGRGWKTALEQALVWACKPIVASE